MPRFGGSPSGRWEKFESSSPIAVDGGLVSSKARGPMASSWWSKRFIDALESYGLGGRMTRGRTYARKGQVLSLEVKPGLLIAQVQGSRSLPYAVTIRLGVPSAVQWAKIEDALRSRIGYAASFLAGEVPTDLESVFADAGCSLFPKSWREMSATCSCPDWGDPCKHQAAVLYVFADQLDNDSWQLLSWLGRTQEQIVALLANSSVAAGGDSGTRNGVVPNAVEIAPWWPLRVMSNLSSQIDGASAAPGSLFPKVALADETGATLARLGPLDVLVYGEPIYDYLLRTYEVLQESNDPVQNAPRSGPEADFQR